MQINDILPPLLSHFNPIGSVSISQALVAGILGNIVFFIIVWIYTRQKKKDKPTFFTQLIGMGYEKIYEFLAQIGGDAVTPKVLTFTSTLFFYVLWNNLFGLLGDMIVLVWPAAHHWFRPVTTDLIFNGTLAALTIIGMFVYGFSHNGFHFISKYLPHKGMGIVDNVDKRRKVITKFLDILLGLLIGIIELLGEFGKILSLSLRLFGNMFVGMLLLTLVLFAMDQVSPIPILGPVVVFGYELGVSFLQALIFSILATVYCKLAGEAH